MIRTIKQGTFHFFSGVVDLSTAHYIPESDTHPARYAFNLISDSEEVRIYTYDTQASYLFEHLTDGVRVVVMGRFRGILEEGIPLFLAARQLGVTLPLSA